MGACLRHWSRSFVLDTGFVCSWGFRTCAEIVGADKFVGLLRNILIVCRMQDSAG